MTEQEFLRCYDRLGTRTILFYKAEDGHIALRFKSISDVFAHMKSPAFRMEHPVDVILDIAFLESFKVEVAAQEILDISAIKEEA